jgi:hypothetical protein
MVLGEIVFKPLKSAAAPSEVAYVAALAKIYSQLFKLGSKEH